MRKIVFRGKNDNGKWVYGVPVPVEENTYETGKIELVSSVNYDELDYYFGSYDSEKVDPNTVGQFTGLVDKNGKKVFEGDVLKISRKMDGMGTYYEPPLEYPVKVVVKWDMCAWMWETIVQDKYYIHFPDAWCHFDCEVVGNIHDNPEERSEENK